MSQKQKDFSDKPLQVEEGQATEVPFNMTTHFTKMQKRYAESDAIFVKPDTWIAPAGPANPKFEKLRKEDWEYVVGVVESREGISSLGLHEMDWCGWPGDGITTWRIPTKRMVAIPRGVAKIIRDECKWKAYVVKERDVSKDDKHGDYLTSWRAEEIRSNCNFEVVSNL